MFRGTPIEGIHWAMTQGLCIYGEWVQLGGSFGGGAGPQREGEATGKGRGRHVPWTMQGASAPVRNKLRRTPRLVPTQMCARLVSQRVNHQQFPLDPPPPKAWA